MEAEESSLVKNLLTEARVLSLGVLVDGRPHVGLLPFVANETTTTNKKVFHFFDDGFTHNSFVCKIDVKRPVVVPFINCSQIIFKFVNQFKIACSSYHRFLFLI